MKSIKWVLQYNFPKEFHLCGKEFLNSFKRQQKADGIIIYRDGWNCTVLRLANDSYSRQWIIHNAHSHFSLYESLIIIEDK